jgi:hypothetical protein
VLRHDSTSPVKLQTHPDGYQADYAGRRQTGIHEIKIAKTTPAD